MISTNDRGSALRTQRLLADFALPAVLLALWALPSARADTLDPTHQAIAGRLEQIALDLKSYKSGQWFGHIAKVRNLLEQCIENLRGADRFHAANHARLATTGAATGASAGVEVESNGVPDEGELDPKHELAVDQLRQISRELTADRPGQWGDFIAKAAADIEDAIDEIQAADAEYSAKHGAVLSPPKGPPVPVSARQAWPSPSYDYFLSKLKDENQRRMLWTYFHLAEQAAHSFVTSPDRWVPLRSVELADKGVPGEWSTRGDISLKPGRHPNDYPGVIFHEIFHTAYQLSELHVKGGDGHWNEAFANAFRYAAEREFMSTPSVWIKKTDKAASKTIEELLAKENSNRIRTYVYPGTLVIKRSGGTISGLRALWLRLIKMRNQAGGNVLDRFFGYSPVKQ